MSVEQEIPFDVLCDLVEYKRFLEGEKLRLRAEACKVAYKVRQLSKKLKPEQIAEVEDFEKNRDAWNESAK